MSASLASSDLSISIMKPYIWSQQWVPFPKNFNLEEVEMQG